MTPAQASGRQNFVTDVPVQGPTDRGLREAACRHAETLPSSSCPSCCERTGLLNDRISYNGAGVSGFSLGAAGDPEVWTKLTAAQQAWVSATLIKLNDLIVKATGTTCPTWGPSITAAGGCFQNWFNANNPGFTKPDGSKLVLRTDGVFDQDTLSALQTIAGTNPTDFPTPYPSAMGAPEKKKLSTAAMVGIAAGGAAVIGGVAYLATRKKSRRRR